MGPDDEVQSATVCLLKPRVFERMVNDYISITPRTFIEDRSFPHALRGVFILYPSLLLLRDASRISIYLVQQKAKRHWCRYGATTSMSILVNELMSVRFRVGILFSMFKDLIA